MNLSRAVYSRDLKITIMRELDAGSAIAEIARKYLGSHREAVCAATGTHTTLGAMLGTAAANPISASGHHGQPWQESLVGVGFQSVSVSIIVSCVLLLWGLRRKTSS